MDAEPRQICDQLNDVDIGRLAALSRNLTLVLENAGFRYRQQYLRRLLDTHGYSTG